LLSILVVEGSNPPWHQKFKKTFYKCLNKLKLYNLQINITNSKYRDFIILSISVTNNNYFMKMTKKTRFFLDVKLTVSKFDFGLNFLHLVITSLVLT
jgi:hypothetical protein